MAIQCVERALQVFSHFSFARTALGIGELSGLMGLPKGTVHGIVRTMVQKGFLHQDAETRKSRLGLRLFELGAMKMAGLGLLLPLMFVYSPVILLGHEEPLGSVLSIIASVLFITAAQIAYTGYFLRFSARAERLLWFASAVLCFLSFPTKDNLLFSAGAGLFVLLCLLHWHKRRSIARAGALLRT
jgi:hypothetical protein